MEKIKNALYNKCMNADFKEVFKKKGYAWFDKGNYNLNIIGIRKNNKGKCTNIFDDILIVEYFINGVHKKVAYNITTEPGIAYLKTPISNNGTAILVPGQYRGCWKVGLHQGKYKALCQCKPVKVYRDKNKDEIYDCNINTIEEGIFGINIHRADKYNESNYINKWSAGCQVFADPASFASFLVLCEKQIKYFGTNSFTYTLLNEDDLC